MGVYSVWEGLNDQNEHLGPKWSILTILIIFGQNDHFWSFLVKMVILTIFGHFDHFGQNGHFDCLTLLGCYLVTNVLKSDTFVHIRGAGCALAVENVV